MSARVPVHREYFQSAFWRNKIVQYLVLDEWNHCILKMIEIIHFQLTETSVIYFVKRVKSFLLKIIEIISLNWVKQVESIFVKEGGINKWNMLF